MINVPLLVDALISQNAGNSLFLYTKLCPAAERATSIAWPAQGRPDATACDISALPSTLSSINKTFNVIVLGEEASASEKLRVLGMCFRAGVVSPQYVVCAIHERTAGGILAPPGNAANTFVFSVNLNYRECKSTVLQSSAGWVSLHSAQKPPPAPAAAAQSVID